MKKILYVSDYKLNEYNSVRDILYNLITRPEMSDYEQVVAIKSGLMHNGISLDNYEGFKVYSDGGDAFFCNKLSRFYFKALHKVASTLRLGRFYYPYANMAYMKSIIKAEKPDLVVFMVFDPLKNFVKLCAKENIPYISVLYDTYIGRPGLNVDKAKKLESFVIERAKGYHVPSFFYDLYLKTYDFSSVSSLDLPLLIEQQQVEDAYKNAKEKIDFSYFGQIQAFRNGDKIKDILKELGVKLDIYSTEKYQSDETFNSHPAVTKEQLFLIVAGSKFLVALDNSFPYQDYLPSKAYLYASFTKPIIAFGDNENSALKTFFKDYPRFFYQNINEPTDELVKFINSTTQDGFDKDCYCEFLRYLPDKAFAQLIKNIKQVID